MTVNQEIAATILRQLGGNKFQAMTGASSFCSGDRALSMRLPRTPKGKFFGLRVELTDSDTYRMVFVKTAGSFAKGDFRTVEHAVDGVYADRLGDIFTSETGLAVRL